MNCGNKAPAVGIGGGGGSKHVRKSHSGKLGRAKKGMVSWTTIFFYIHRNRVILTSDGRGTATNSSNENQTLVILDSAKKVTDLCKGFLVAASGLKSVSDLIINVLKASIGTLIKSKFKITVLLVLKCLSKLTMKHFKNKIDLQSENSFGFVITGKDEEGNLAVGVYKCFPNDQDIMSDQSFYYNEIGDFGALGSGTTFAYNHMKNLKRKNLLSYKQMKRLAKRCVKIAHTKDKFSGPNVYMSTLSYPNLKVKHFPMTTIKDKGSMLRRGAKIIHLQPEIVEFTAQKIALRSIRRDIRCATVSEDDNFENYPMMIRNCYLVHELRCSYLEAEDFIKLDLTYEIMKSVFPPSSFPIQVEVLTPCIQAFVPMTLSYKDGKYSLEWLFHNKMYPYHFCRGQRIYAWVVEVDKSRGNNFFQDENALLEDYLEEEKVEPKLDTNTVTVPRRKFIFLSYDAKTLDQYLKHAVPEDYELMYKGSPWKN